MAETPKQQLARYKKDAEKKIDEISASAWTPVYKRMPTRETSGQFSDELRAMKDKAGVYFITESKKGSKDVEIIYVGMSEYDLKNTVTRHFQSWNDRDQQSRISYKNRMVTKKSHTYEVALLQCSPRTAKLVERELILIYAPRDNKEKLAFFEQASDLLVIERFLKEFARHLSNRKSRIREMLANPSKYSKKGSWKTEQRQKLLQDIKKIDLQLRSIGDAGGIYTL